MIEQRKTYQVVIEGKVFKNDKRLEIANIRNTLHINKYETQKEYEQELLKWVERNERRNMGKLGQSVLKLVMTFKEASEKYDVAVSTLRHRASDERFQEEDIRKSGKTWLVTKSAMDRIYGNNSSA